MMTTEERQAYLEETLRKAPVGSARRVWAEAQLAQLRGGGVEREGAKGTKTTKREGRAGGRR